MQNEAMNDPSATAPFSRYAALLSLGDGDLGDNDPGGVRDAVEAAGDRVGWANLHSNSWRPDKGLFRIGWSL